MDIYTEIQDKLETKKFQKSKKHSGSGCISTGDCYETDDGPVFVKFNSKNEALPMFAGEMASLNAIRKTETIYVPEPKCIVADPKSNGGALVLEFLNLTTVKNWQQLGSDLADLHLFNQVLRRKKEKRSSWIGKPATRDVPHDVESVFKKDNITSIPDELVDEMEYVDQFGFDVPTCCGIIPQNNEWNSDWIQFYARNRLDYQINLVMEKDGDRQVNDYWSILQIKLDRFFKDLTIPIEPCLLHGDLWAGNIGQVDDRPVIFDAAAFYGHSEFDLSIAILFHGFQESFYKEYFRKLPKNKGFDQRNDLYKLFHTLNHWNHFGSHKIQTKQLMRKLTDQLR